MKKYITVSTCGETKAGQKNDCTIRATANALGLPYDYVESKARGYYTPSKGMTSIEFCKFMNYLGQDLIEVYGDTKGSKLMKYCIGSWMDKKVETKKGTNLENLLNTLNPNKSYIVGIRGHVLAVVEGKIIDTFNPKANSYVAFVVEIKE